MVVWGKPKSGKTFWVLDLVLHIASGMSYRGRAVEHSPVFYCAFEGMYAFPDRIAAMADHLGIAGTDVPFFYCPTHERFTKVGGAAGLIRAIQETGYSPGAVVWDTLNMSFEGEENSGEDMAFYTKCAADVSDIFDCVVIVVHHCGVEGTRPRGHTSLTGTCDAQLRVERATKVSTPGSAIMIQTKVEFMKDGPEGLIEFSWLQPANGIDSCYVEPAPAPSTKPDGMFTSHTQKAISILQKAADRTGDSRMTIEEWRSAFRNLHKGDKDSANRTFNRAYARLRESGSIDIVDNIHVELSDRRRAE